MSGLTLQDSNHIFLNLSSMYGGSANLVISNPLYCVPAIVKSQFSVTSKSDRSVNGEKVIRVSWGRCNSSLRQWLHTTKTGIVFLLAKESGLEKWYYGFDTYVMLSSGIVRYFLELCEQAFNFAIMNGFGWEQPSPLSPEIQTKAARFVSRYKVEETSSFPLYGSNLRIFIQCLGQIFKELHRNERLTLGEPEPNHFTMDALDSLDHRDVLDCAITCSALQELPQTKGKEALNTHVLDYHLNKIYTPYFEISYFKKRKIVFTNSQISDLLSGDKSKAEQVTKAYLDRYWVRKNTIPESKDLSQQTTLF